MKQALLFFMVLLSNSFVLASGISQKEDSAESDFITISIAPKTWVSELKRQSEKGDKKEYSYFYRDYFKPYKEDRVIKKWNAPLRILENEDDIIRDQTRKISKIIRRITGLEILSVSDNANVEIRLYPKGRLCAGIACPSHAIHRFKTGWPHTLYTYLDDTYRNILGIKEPQGFIYFKDVTLFTADSSKSHHKTTFQVEGFIASDEKQNIFYSECFIHKDHPENIKRILTTECLFRMLGLPNISNNSQSILRQRNGLEDFESSVRINDYDISLIKTLYDKKMEKGFDKSSIRKMSNNL